MVGFCPFILALITSKSILKPFQDFLISEFEEKPQLEIEDWATKQAYLAMGNMLTVCATQEVDACPMEGFDANAVDEILNLREKGLRSCVLLPLGYRDTENDWLVNLKKVRKSTEDLVTVVE